MNTGIIIKCSEIKARATHASYFCSLCHQKSEMHFDETIQNGETCCKMPIPDGMIGKVKNFILPIGYHHF